MKLTLTLTQHDDEQYNIDTIESVVLFETVTH